MVGMKRQRKGDKGRDVLVQQKRGERGATVTHMGNGKPKGIHQSIKYYRWVPNAKLYSSETIGGVSIYKKGGRYWRTHLAPIQPLKNLEILSKKL